MESRLRGEQSSLLHRTELSIKIGAAEYLNVEYIRWLVFKYIQRVIRSRPIDDQQQLQCTITATITQYNFAYNTGI